MQKKDVVLGETYIVKVSGKEVPVRIDKENRNGGWDGVNTVTKKGVRIKTAARLRKPVTETRATAKKAASSKAKASKTSTPKAPAKSPAKTPVFRIFDEGDKKWKDIPDAKPVRFKGFDDFTFYLHKGTGIKPSWVVSEACSGSKVCSGPTQKAAKDSAKDAIEKHGLKSLTDCIKRMVAKNGGNPDFPPPWSEASPEATQEFKITAKDGTTVDVTYTPDMKHHLEYRGEISPTGYRSSFAFDGKGDVKAFAAKEIESLREAMRKSGKAVDKASSNEAVVSARLKSKILAALMDKKHQPLEKIHIDELTKAVGNTKGKSGDTAAACKVLEIAGSIRCLPGGFIRLSTAEEQAPVKRGRKPTGEMSQIDAAATVLKDASEPLACKDMVRGMMERKLWKGAGRTPEATLSASIQREISRKGAEARFRKVSRGLFEYAGK